MSTQQISNRLVCSSSSSSSSSSGSSSSSSSSGVSVGCNSSRNTTNQVVLSVAPGVLELGEGLTAHIFTGGGWCVIR